jgi:hypothetical protein
MRNNRNNRNNKKQEVPAIMQDTTDTKTTKQETQKVDKASVSSNALPLRKGAKERTLDEFKNWLEGLCEFQPNDWSPNNEQWNMIVDAIYMITEPEYEEYEEETIQYSPNPVVNTAPNVPKPQMPRQMTNQVPSQMPRMNRPVAIEESTLNQTADINNQQSGDDFTPPPPEFA